MDPVTFLRSGCSILQFTPPAAPDRAPTFSHRRAFVFPLQPTPPSHPPKPPDPPDPPDLRFLPLLLLLSSAGSSVWLPVTLRLCPAKRRLLWGLEIFKLSPVLSTTKTACLRVSCFRPDVFIPALLPVLQVSFCSSLPGSCYVVSYRVLEEWKYRVFWIVGLGCSAPIGLVPFGSTLMPFSCIHVASVRSLPAVCSLGPVFNPAFGAVSVVFLSWWQVEGKLSALSLPVNLVLSNSFKELPSSPIFSPMWSNLDIQASPVLQGSSSWLIVFSAFGAVLVILRVTMDVVIQEAHEIVLVVRFLLAYFYGLYRQSISRLTTFCWSFWHFLPCFCVSPFDVVVSRTLSIEVVTF